MIKEGTFTILKREAADVETNYDIKDERFVPCGRGDYSRSCVEIVILMDEYLLEIRGKFAKYHKLRNDKDDLSEDCVEAYDETLFHRTLTEEFGNWQIYSKPAMNDERYIKYLENIMGFEAFNTSSADYSLFKSDIENLIASLVKVQ